MIEREDEFEFRIRTVVRRYSETVFFVVVLGLFALVNFYIIRRGWQALAGLGAVRIVVFCLYLGLFVSLFVSRIVFHRHPGRVSEVFAGGGFFFFGVMIYFFLMIILIDLFRLANRVFPFFPSFVRANGRLAGRWAFGVVVGMTLVLLIGGWIHSRHFRIKTMEITIAKQAGTIQDLDVVLLSDIHVGPFLYNPSLEKIVAAINSLNPDIVLVPGDVLNEETLPDELEKMTVTFRKIRSRWGVFASTGNHEYFAGIKKSLALLARSDMTVLQNEARLIADSFYVVGRNNSNYIGSREKRTPLKDILAGANMSLPVILLDHQPVHLEEAADAGVDLQLSGHTHAGAIFPITLINDLIWEIGRGYGRKKNTQYYVSSGVGVWAPPARIGTTAEIVHMKIKFRP